MFSGPLSGGVDPRSLEIGGDDPERIVPSPLATVFVSGPGPQRCHRSALQMGLLRNARYVHQKKKKDGFWTGLKQTADVPCVLHAHCSPDVGPMKSNTCEGPLSLSLSKLFHFLDSDGSQLVRIWLLFPSCWSPIQSLHRRFCNLFHPNEDQHYKHTVNQSLKDPFNKTEHPPKSDYQPTDWKHLILILP